MSKKKTVNIESHDDFINQMSIMHPELQVISPYISKSKHVRIQTKYGVCLLRPNDILRGYKPTIKSAENKTEYFKNVLKEKHFELFNKIEIIGSYTTNSDYIHVKVKYGICNVVPMSLIQGSEPTILSALDKDQFFKNSVEDLQPELFSKIQIIGNYINLDTPIQVNTKYGICEVIPYSLQSGYFPQIQTALNKLEYFLNQYKETNNNNLKDFEILNIIIEPNNNILLLKDKYGIIKYSLYNILLGYIPDIESSINPTEYWINQAREVHGERYDYSLVEYKGSKEKVVIKCKEHNKLFEQLPSKHTIKQNTCSECKKIIYNLSQPTLLNTETFKERFYKKYPKSDLKIIKYTNAFDILVEHKYGLCNLQAYNFMKSGGCNIESALDKTSFFINKLKSEHPEFLKFDYSASVYVNNSTPVLVRCLEHNHIFEMSPTNHYKSPGCQFCVNETRGWEWSKWKKRGEKSRYFDSFKLYIIECWNDNEKFYKIGKTFTTTQRRFVGKSTMPYNYKIIKEIVADAYTICKLEMLNQRVFKDFRYKPSIKFGGSTLECFSFFNIDNLVTKLPTD